MLWAVAASAGAVTMLLDHDLLLDPPPPGHIATPATCSSGSDMFAPRSTFTCLNEAYYAVTARLQQHACTPI